MKKLDEVLVEQIDDIKGMLEKLKKQPKSEKQKEKLFNVLQNIQNKLDNLIK